jgi:glycosyltransferase involved in cell wall biosynthesis
MPSLRGAGAERVLITILQNLDYGVYDVNLFLLYYDGEFISEVPAGVRTLYLFKKPQKRLRKLETYLYKYFGISWVESFRIRTKIAKRYDAIVSFMEGSALKYHSYIYRCTKNNISWIHTDFATNHYTICNSFSKHHEICSYKKMDTLIFVSKGALAHFERAFTNDCEKRVIYNPVDKNHILLQAQRYFVPKRKFTICSVGTVMRTKGYDRILRIAKKLKDDGFDLEFWIIGEGGLKAELIKERDLLGLETDVHFFGFKNPPYPYMKSADILFLPSLTEGFSMVICEAMCIGLPVVATNCTGPQELLDNGKYGILTEQTDESLENGLKSLIENPEILAKYKRLSEERSKIFDLDSTMKEIVKVFKKSKLEVGG